jgi:hypothetical protein
MIFYAIFWTTYLPFVVLTLSLLADRLTHHTESDAATQTKPVPAPAKPSGRARRTPARPSDLWPSDCGQVTSR